MSEFFKHNLNLTEHNLNKIGNNVQTSIRHDQIGQGMTVHLCGTNHNKVMASHKKGVGCRIHLTKEEMDQNLEHGTGLGKFLNHTFGHNTARKIKNTGKMIARNVLSYGVPALAATLGPLSGVAGAVAGNVAAQSSALQNGGAIKYDQEGRIVRRKKTKKQLKLKGASRRVKAAYPDGYDYHSDSDIDENVIKAGGSIQGEGFFKTMHKLGVSKKQIKRVGKRMAKAVGHAAVTTAAIIASEKMADNPLGQQMIEHANNIAHNAIESKVDAVHEIAHQATQDMLPEAHKSIHKSVLHHTNNADLAQHLADSAHAMVVDGLERHGRGLKMRKMRFGGNINDYNSVLPNGSSNFIPRSHPSQHPFISYGSPHDAPNNAPKSNREVRAMTGGSFY
jgi:hypothetical protein